MVGAVSFEDAEHPETIDLEDYETAETSARNPMSRDLSQTERLLLNVQLDVPTVAVRFPGLYRYATKRDKIVVFICSLCAICGGAAMPLMTIVVGTIAGDLQGFLLHRTDGSSLRHALGQKSLYFVYLAIGQFILIYVATVGFVFAGEVIASRVRALYLKAVLRQNTAFFDNLGTGEILVHLTADVNHIQDGISEKVAVTLTALATFNSAFVICFVKYWKLTIICLSTVVAIFTTVNLGALFLVKFKKRSFEAYAVGGSVVEESLTSMTNATAFGIQDRLARLYYKHLLAAEELGLKFKHTLAVMIGFIVCFNFLNYGLVLWMGSRFLVDGDVLLSQILTIILAITIATFSLGQIGPNFESFTAAIAAASKIYAHIDRKSPLDPLSVEGGSLPEVRGNITLKDIKLIYPSRSDVVLEGFDLAIPARQTTALVGASGSGKSSIISLIERFYNPVGGEVRLDDHPISTLNLSWLRQQMSLVQQEPVLFDDTIFHNIKIGLLGSQVRHESEEQETNRIIEAAKTANAHNFIMALPEGYQTRVGSSSLSGGEKQRVAIARAIVKNPKILLLDEPTSALDADSERVVQAALERAAENRTTLIIAHRLSTIRAADNIVVMHQGQIVEQGTHLTLMENRDLYFDLFAAQRDGYLKAESVARSDVTTLGGRPRTSTLGTPTTITSFEEALSYVNNEAPIFRDLGTYDHQQTSLLHSENGQSTQLETSSDYFLWDLVKFTASFNRDDKTLMFVGLLASIIAGGGQPTQAVFFAKGIEALALPLAMRDRIRSDVDFWCWMYFMLAFVQLLALLLQGFVFAFCSERLIRRARDRAFRTILRQEINFFEKQEHSSGALTTFLATEISHLAGLSGVTLGTILTCITTIIAAVTVSLAIGWKLALVTTTTIPVILGCGFFRIWALTRFRSTAQKAYARSAAFASEHVSAIRTVASLTMERDVNKRYQDMLSTQEEKSLPSNLKNSSLYAASQSLTPLCIALGFWYGGTLISHREYSLFQFFVCLIQIIFSVQSAGTVFSFAADIAKARNAASQLKKLLDEVPQIDTWSNEGEKTAANDLDTIEFANVHFRYSNRPNTPILRGLNLTVRHGQFVALVGASGCGKSTIISLLERFYDPSQGIIRLGGNDIRNFNVNDYRSCLALVSQEPVLYQGTINENLRLGVNREVSDESLIRACKEANIYDFITSLPDGFATECGSKAALLSTGQKQRIAIARALLRDPQILLLDEATSALDSESERLVQNALNAARKGRTTIAVAHRLSSIQHADMICVIDGGVITERGTHDELMARRGKYRDLVSLQSLGVQL